MLLESNGSNKAPGLSFLRTKFSVVLRITLIYIVYLLAFTILDSRAHALQVFPGIVAWYPPDGLSFALLLTIGAPFLPGLVVASFISSLLAFQVPLPYSALFGWAIFLSLTYGVAAWFLRRIRIDNQLRSIRDLFWMIASASVVSTILAWVSTSGTSIGIPQAELFWATFQWWIGEMIGILALTPALLIHVMPHVKRFADGGALFPKSPISFKRPTFRVLLQALTILAAIYLAVNVNWLNNFHPYFLIGIPLVWIAIEHGLPGVSLANVLANFGMTWAVLGHQHFDLVELGKLQSMLLVVTMASLIIGTIVSDNMRSAHSATPEIERRRRMIAYEWIIISVLAMAAWVLEYSYNIFQRVSDWEARNQVKGINETLATILVLGVASSVFSLRRWREYQVELRKREKAQTELHALYSDLEAKVQERTVDLSKANERLRAEITERKQAEEALLHSERRSRALIEHSMEEVSLVDIDGNLIYESPTRRQPLGYPLGAFVGRSLIELIHPDDLATSINLLKEVSGEPGSYREALFRLHHQDGSWRWMEGTVINLLDDPAVGAIVINYRDITERKQAERALSESEELFRLLFTTSPEAILLIDPHSSSASWPIVDCNDTACRMNGYSREEIIGQSIDILNTVPGTHEGRMAYLERLRHEKALHTEDLHKHKDGHIFPVEISTSLFTFDGRELILGIDRDVTERKLAEEEIRTRTDELSMLYELARTLATANDLDTILDLVTHRTVESMHATFARIALLEGDEFVTRSAYPIRNLGHDMLIDSRKPITAMPYCQRVMEQDEPVILRTGNWELIAEERTALLLDFAQTLCLIPLRVHDFTSHSSRILGLLMVGEVRTEEREPFTPEKMRLARSIGDQAAITIDNTRLFNDLERSNVELSDAYDATIAGWSAALDLRDKETEGHTQRVAEITLGLAKRMGFSEQELVQVRRGALLHDIGKMGVPDRILLKPDKLTDEEWGIMRMHPSYAFQMLKPITYLRLALDIPYCHHEKWDGTGYPRRLKETQIPLAARVFAIVDVYDALTSDRPYRKGWSIEKTLDHIREQSGTHFDPQVVNAFLKMLEEDS